MLSGRTRTVAAKSWPRLCLSAQFRFRQALSKVPYFPVPIRLTLSEQLSLSFWWSRLVPYHDPNRKFLDYWGHDAGDLRFLWRALEPEMTFLDVGANLGAYSLVAAHKLADNGCVIAFEPGPRESARLKLHFRWNGLRAPEARMERVSLGAHTGEQKFFEVLTGGDTSRNGLRPPQIDDAVREVATSVITLDRYAAKRGLTRIDFIKLDVEGGEMDVLRGASASLLRHRPILICEVLDLATAPWGYPAREIVSALADYGYRWFDVNRDGSLSPHIPQRDYPAIRNYLAVPCEKCTNLLRVHAA
jgi:FkbM family methyltransferase